MKLWIVQSRLVGFGYWTTCSIWTDPNLAYDEVDSLEEEDDAAFYRVEQVTADCRNLNGIECDPDHTLLELMNPEFL